MSMPDTVMILGGYGNFGKRIAVGLKARGIKVIICGRDAQKAQTLAKDLDAEFAAFDVRNGLAEALRTHKPRLVVHTAGPFQNADYSLARTCIAAGIHYIDLADARDFVRNFTDLDAEAKAAKVIAICGASTVPALSSAVIDHYRSEFASLDDVDFGICPGQRTERGLATIKAILSYVGKPLRPFAGHPKAYGWQDLRRHRFPLLGGRWISDCDIPDLDLLPEHYGLKSTRFGAGLEIGLIHIGLWCLSWGVRLRLLPFALPRIANPLHHLANAFNLFGSEDGGMYMRLSGQGPDGAPKALDWHIIAKSGDGPQIPCVPAILLAEQVIRGDKPLPTGAYSSLGLVSLDAYMGALKPFDVQAIPPVEL